jgi:hypothetical protein
LSGFGERLKDAANARQKMTVEVEHAKKTLKVFDVRRRRKLRMVEHGTRGEKDLWVGHDAQDSQS